MSLPPLPETDLFLCFYDEGGIQEASGYGFTADQMRAYAAAAVASEQARWAKPVQAMLDAHDASLVRLGEMMRANGVTTIRIDGAAQAELDAIAALRSLVSATQPQSSKP